MNALLIQHGRVVDPATGTDAKLDILIVEDKIAEVKPSLRSESARRTSTPRASSSLPASSTCTSISGSRGSRKRKRSRHGTPAAAARGGFTTVCCMPNTNPSNDSSEISPVHSRPGGQRRRSMCFPSPPSPSASKGASSRTWPPWPRPAPSPFPTTASPSGIRAHARGPSKGARPRRPSSSTIARTKASAEAEHARGRNLRPLGSPGIPAAAEEIMVARDIVLAESLGAGPHRPPEREGGDPRPCKEARERGVRVSAEATPHHLL